MHRFCAVLDIDVNPPVFVRYLARLKSPTALENTIARAIQFLLGKERFVGRDRP